MEGAYLLDDQVLVIWNWRWLEPNNDEQIGSESLDSDKNDSETKCDLDVGKETSEGEENCGPESNKKDVRSV